MPSAPLSARVIRKYCDAKKAARKAHKAYLTAKKDVDKKYARLLSFPKVVIRSKVDLKTVIELKKANKNWEVKVKLPTKYKPNGKYKPSEKRLQAMVSNAQIPFMSRRVRG